MGRKTKFRPFDHTQTTNTNKEHEPKEAPYSSRYQSRGSNRDVEREDPDIGGSWRDRPPRNQFNNNTNHRQMPEAQFRREGNNGMPQNDDDTSEDAPKGAWGAQSRRWQPRSYRNHPEADNENEQFKPNDDSMRTAENKQDDMSKVPEKRSNLWSDDVANETSQEPQRGGESRDTYSGHQRNYNDRNQQSDRTDGQGQKLYRAPSYNRNRESDGYQQRDRDSKPMYNRNRNWDRDNDSRPWNRNDDSNPNNSRNWNRDSGSNYRNREFQHRDRDNGSESSYGRNSSRGGGFQHRDREGDRNDTGNWRENRGDNRPEKRDNYSTGGRGQVFSKQSGPRVERGPDNNSRGSNFSGTDSGFRHNPNTSTNSSNSTNNWNVETTNQVPLPDMNETTKTWESDCLPNASNVTVDDPAEITDPESSNLNPHAQTFHLESSPNAQSWHEMSAEEGDKEYSSQLKKNETFGEKSIEFDMKTQCAINENENVDDDEGINSKSSKIPKKSDPWDRSKRDNGSQSRGQTSYSMDMDNSYSKDEEYKEYRKFSSSREIKYVRVVEVEKDLFSVGPEYALAHCVAEDMKMGSGIAVRFCQTFRNRGELLEQRKQQGDVAILSVPIKDSNETRFVYYMITKRYSEGKPTYETLWTSMKKMREHIIKENVKKLAIPRIGCGLDRLEWDFVKPMLEFAFRDVEIEILVCNFLQLQDEAASPSSRQSFNKSCKIVMEPRSITEIEKYTMILYFATKDGQITPAMSELDKKFSFILDFRRSPKNLGENVLFEYRNGEYLLYGCVVADKMGGPLNFIHLEKCLFAIQKANKSRKEKYEYVAFQRIDDGEDSINEKILGLMKHVLKDVDIYCCAAPKRD